jgi:hypothetical protein
MIDVDAQDAFEVLTINNEQPVEALTHGPHASLGDGVRALGARNGVRTTSTPSLWTTSSTVCANVLSRSSIR